LIKSYKLKKLQVTITFTESSLVRQTLYLLLHRKRKALVNLL